MDGRSPSNGGLTADESQLLYAVSAMHGQHGPEAQREAHASLMVFQASVEAWGVFLRLLRIVSASADSASTSTGTSDSASAGTFASASAAVASASASAGPQGHSEAERFYVLQALGDKVARQWAQCPGECRVPLLESATHLVQLVVGGATDLSPLLVRRLCLLFAGLALRASPEEWPDPFGDMHSLLLAGGGGGDITFYTKKEGNGFGEGWRPELYFKQGQKGHQSAGKVKPRRLAPSSAHSENTFLVNRGYKHHFTR